MDDIKQQLSQILQSLPDSEIKSELQAKVETTELTLELIDDIGSEISAAIIEQQKKVADILANADASIEKVRANYEARIKDLKKQENKKKDEQDLDAVRKQISGSQS